MFLDSGVSATDRALSGCAYGALLSDSPSKIEDSQIHFYVQATPGQPRVTVHTIVVIECFDLL